MKKRTMIRIISYLTALFLVLGISAFRGNYHAIQYQNALESSYRKSLDELTSLMGNIQNTLLKGTYVGTPAQISMIRPALEGRGLRQILSFQPAGGGASSGKHLPLPLPGR